MYIFVLSVHSALRWVVILAGAAAVARAVYGWRGQKSWTSLDNRLGLIFTIAVDVQVILGLALYVFLSPATAAAFQDLGAAMTDPVARFWIADHVGLMILALVLSHVGRVAAKKAPGSAQRHRRAALIFGGAVIAIVVATPWPFLSYGRPLLRLG